MDRQRKDTHWFAISCPQGTRSRRLVPAVEGIRRAAWILDDVRLLVWATQLRHTHSSYCCGNGEDSSCWVGKSTLHLDRITKFEDSDAFTATHLDLVAWIFYFWSSQSMIAAHGGFTIQSCFLW